MEVVISTFVNLEMSQTSKSKNVLSALSAAKRLRLRKESKVLNPVVERYGPYRMVRDHAKLKPNIGIFLNGHSSPRDFRRL